jgi:signal transduction histidine kinase
MIDSFLSKLQRHWGFWPGVFALLSAVILGLNLVAGPHVQLSFLFVLPVILTAWYAGWSVAAALSLLLVGTRLFVALAYESSITPVWAAWLNAGIRISMLLVVVKLVAFARSKRDSVALLSRKLLEVREAEQQRLSRELHDDVGQLLALAKLNLNSAINSATLPNTDELNHCREAIERAVERVKDLSLSLRPSSLDGLGLAASLRQLCIQVQNQSGLEVHFHDEIGPARFQQELEIHLYRIVQEALTNCLKHSQAENAWVSLEVGNQTLRVEIQDDGIGFERDATLEAARRKGSLGLVGMFERAEILGGDLKIESKPDGGASINCRIPLGAEKVDVADIAASDSRRSLCSYASVGTSQIDLSTKPV